MTIQMPNLVILTTGAAGSSVFTAMLGQLGWNLGRHESEWIEKPASTSYQPCEHQSIRGINIEVQAGQRFPAKMAASVLESLPQPWVIKDPRFHDTLHKWTSFLQPYDPVLIWLQKPLHLVEKSFDRRGITRKSMLMRHRACRKQYEDWPMRKMEMDVESVANAVRLFDLERHDGS